MARKALGHLGIITNRDVGPEYKAVCTKHAHKQLELGPMGALGLLGLFRNKLSVVALAQAQQDRGKCDIGDFVMSVKVCAIHSKKGLKRVTPVHGVVNGDDLRKAHGRDTCEVGSSTADLHRLTNHVDLDSRGTENKSMGHVMLHCAIQVPNFLINLKQRPDSTTFGH